MLGLLDRLGVEGRVDVPAADAPADRAPVESAPLSSWQDIDASLAEYCAVKGLAAPAGIEEAIALHLRAMEEWLDDLEFRLKQAGDFEGA
jgi:hypothetical protein